MKNKKPLGLYIHIPFCKSKCDYCDFCSMVPNNRGILEHYTDALLLQMEDYSRRVRPYLIDTVYIGGGTPTFLDEKRLSRIIDGIYRNFKVAKKAEFTVEANPATCDIKYLRRIRRLGVNRLSMGLQSANDNELRALGRIHTFREFEESYDLARDAGFDNISIDLMYGIPEQTVKSFENTLRRAVELSPEHISAYGLKIEDGTVFGKIRESLTLPDEDDELRMYLLCKSILKENGYERYEISNFAKEGRASRHNLRYWRLDDYIGFGVAAHSLVDGERFGNSRDIDAFLRGEDIVEERACISKEERLREYVMLGLRLESGISADEYRALSGREMCEDMQDMKRFIDAGFLLERDGRICFSDKGFFVSNAILSELLF